MNKDLERLQTVVLALNKLRSKSEDLYYLLSGRSNVPDYMYDKALELLKIADGLVTYLKDTDKNMEVGALEPVDKYFKDHPVTEYVNAILDHLEGKITKEEAVERAEKAASEINKEEKSDVRPEVTTPENELVKEALAFVKDKEIKDEFHNSLLRAVMGMRNKKGAQHFYFDINGSTISGFIESDGEKLTLEINDNKYELRDGLVYEGARPEEQGDCTGDPYTCQKDECCVENKPAFSESSHCCKDECFPEREDRTSLIDFVREFEEETKFTTFEIMDAIESHLNNKKTFDKDDIELIRFYLKNLPYNSDYDIDELSDKAIVLAWKQHVYRKGF